PRAVDADDHDDPGALLRVGQADGGQDRARVAALRPREDGLDVFADARLERVAVDELGAAQPLLRVLHQAHGGLHADVRREEDFLELRDGLGGDLAAAPTEESGEAGHEAALTGLAQALEQGLPGLGLDPPAALLFLPAPLLLLAPALLLELGLAAAFLLFSLATPPLALGALRLLAGVVLGLPSLIFLLLPARLLLGPEGLFLARHLRGRGWLGGRRRRRSGRRRWGEFFGLLFGRALPTLQEEDEGDDHREKQAEARPEHPGGRLARLRQRTHHDRSEKQ